MSPYLLTALVSIGSTLFIIYLAAPVSCAIASIVIEQVRSHLIRREKARAKTDS